MCNKMSDVRLSNASPTVERVDARQPDAARPPVSRNLFGTPDRDEVRTFLDAAIGDDGQRFVERYNFDPVAHRPLAPGDYEWQEDADAPEFYRRRPHGSAPSPPPLPPPPPPPPQQRGDREGAEGRRGRSASRKRTTGAPGPGRSKRLHTDEDTGRGEEEEDDDDYDDEEEEEEEEDEEEEDRSGGAGSRPVEDAERPGSPETSAGLM